MSEQERQDLELENIIKEFSDMSELKKYINSR